MLEAALRTILVVDDDFSVRESLRRVLEEAGYVVIAASSAAEALQTLQRGSIQLVISDQQMPEMSGVDLLKLVRVRHPNVVRIMLTGSLDPETPVRSINEGEVYRFIRKPWSNSELRTTVDVAFEKLRREEAERHRISEAQERIAASGESGVPQLPANDPADLELEVLALAETEIDEG